MNKSMWVLLFHIMKSVKQIKTLAVPNFITISLVKFPKCIRLPVQGVPQDNFRTSDDWVKYRLSTNEFQLILYQSVLNVDLRINNFT